MGRKILAVIVAMITAVAIIWVVEMVGTLFGAHAPKNMEYMTRGELGAYMGTLPAGAYLTVIVGYLIAAFAGGFIVTKMARRESSDLSLTLIVGGLLTLGGIVNYITLPGQPLWFGIVSLLVFIPSALVAYRFAR